MPLTSREMIKHLQKNGFVTIGQNGSHVKLKNPENGKTIIVPSHGQIPRSKLWGMTWFLFSKSAPRGGVFDPTGALGWCKFICTILNFAFARIKI